MSNIEPIIQSTLDAILPAPVVVATKKSLSELIAAVDEMESVIDNCDEITQEMVREHFEAIQAVDEKTDKLIGFIERMRMESAKSSEKAEAYEAKAKAYKNASERCVEYAKYLLKHNPSLEYRGKLGRLALQRTAPKLVITTPQYRFSTERMIPDEMIMSIPEKFRKVKVAWIYDTDVIREALKAGEETPIARLDENVSLRIRLV